MRRAVAQVVSLGVILVTLCWHVAAAGEVRLRNVCCEPLQELYQDYDDAFARYWKGKTGQEVSVIISPGPSGKQAQAVIKGMEADVAALASESDIDAIAGQAHLLPVDWRKQLPNGSSPYFSTVLFLVRKGNPKAIKDWDDLIKPGVIVITPNPKLSGGGRWNYLAAYGYELKKSGGDEGKARGYVEALYRNVPALDNGAREAMTNFAARGIGDVLIAWESEAILSAREMDEGRVQIVVPSLTIEADPAVAVLDEVAKRSGTEAVAKAYLEYLYSPEGQEIAARNYFRPRLASVMGRYVNKFPDVKTFTIGEVFGGWRKAQAHFEDGGIFDSIRKSRN